MTEICDVDQCKDIDTFPTIWYRKICVGDLLDPENMFTVYCPLKTVGEFPGQKSRRPDYIVALSFIIAFRRESRGIL